MDLQNEFWRSAYFFLAFNLNQLISMFLSLSIALKAIAILTAAALFHIVNSHTWLAVNGQYRKLCWTVLLWSIQTFTVCATSHSQNRWPQDQNMSSQDWNASMTTQFPSKLSLSTNVLDIFFSFYLMMHIIAFPILSQGLQIHHDPYHLSNFITPLSLELNSSELQYFTFFWGGGYNFKLDTSFVWNIFSFLLNVSSILWHYGTL